MISPLQTHVIFDLEATHPDPTRVEIVEIAALVPGREFFHCYVATEREYPEDHEVWAITHIDPATYHKSKMPLE